MLTSTIQALTLKAVLDGTEILEISETGTASFKTPITGFSTIFQLLSLKGAVSGYAGLDASQLLELANFPTGTGLQVLRRNTGNTALEFATLSDLQGITSINADTTAAQLIVGTTNVITAGTVAGTTTIDIDSAYVGQSSITTLGTITTGVWNGTAITGANINAASTDLTDSADLVRNNAATTYTAGVRQDFLGLLAGTAGLNVGGIAGNPTTQVDGDVWLNTSTNQLFGRINGADVDLGGAGEVFTWTANHSMATFKLTATASNDVILNAPTGQGVSIEVNAVQAYLFNATVADYLTKDIDNVGNFTMSKTGDTRILLIERDEVLADDTIIGQTLIDSQDGGNVLDHYVRLDGVMESDLVDNEDGSYHIHVAEAGLFDTKYMAFNDASSALIDILRPVNFNSQNVTNMGTLNTHTIGGGTSTFALFSDNLSVFAATTSAQLLGVISDETGSGLLVFGTSPTIVTPTIASFTNATHDHSNAAGGGNLTNTALTTGVFSAITGVGTQTQDLDMGGQDVAEIQNTRYDLSTLVYNATLDFDFDTDQYQTVTLTGDLTTLTTSNRSANNVRGKTVYVVGDTVNRTLTFNTDWLTNPSTATVIVTANTTGILSLNCNGTAETDVFAVYAEFV